MNGAIPDKFLVAFFLGLVITFYKKTDIPPCDFRGLKETFVQKWSYLIRKFENISVLSDTYDEC